MNVFCCFAIYLTLYSFICWGNALYEITSKLSVLFVISFCRFMMKSLGLWKTLEPMKVDSSDAGQEEDSIAIPSSQLSASHSRQPSIDSSRRSSHQVASISEEEASAVPPYVILQKQVANTIHNLPDLTRLAWVVNLIFYILQLSFLIREITIYVFTVRGL